MRTLRPAGLGVGIFAPSPANPNAPLSAGRLVAEGDSLTVGYPDQVPWTTYFSSAHPAPTVWNVATGGESVTTHMISQAASEVDSHYSAGAPWNVCVLWGGTNDMVNESRTAAATYSSVSSYCTSRKGVGWKVIVCNTIRRVDLSEGTRATFNGLLDSDHSFADRLVDLSAVLGDWNTKPSLWQVDQIHITSAGSQLVSDAIVAAVRAII